MEMQGVSHNPPGHADAENRYESLQDQSAGDHKYEALSASLGKQRQGNATTNTKEHVYENTKRR